MTRRLLGLVLAATMASQAVVPAVAQSGDGVTDEEAAVIVATQLRSQGYQCDDPHSAARDNTGSAPGEEAWIVTCDNATYRVKLVPDQAAKVEQID